MNSFEKHGMSHVSASLINGWIEHPALTLLKIAGIDNGEAGPAAWRGISAEHAMNIAAEQQLDFGDLVKAAQCKFDEIHEKAEESHDEQKIERERKALEDYATQGVMFLRDWMGDAVRPPLMQGKVKLELDDIPVPVIGYYDMLFENPHHIVDIKTAASRPKSASYAHSRQLAIYWAGTGAEPWVWYVNRHGVSTFTIHKPDAYLRQFITATKSLERVLAQSNDIFECCQFVYPDIDHWIWGETVRAAAKDIWKMEI